MKYFISIVIICLITACENKSQYVSKTSAVQKSLIEKKIFLNRDTYKMQYYKNWTLDSTDEDYDIDSYFSFNSPSKSGFASFFIFNTEVDEKEHLDNQIKEQLKVTMKNGKVSYYKNWGNYKGSGANINGKILGILKGEIKIFSHSCDSCSFLTLSMIYDSDIDLDKKGLDLMEGTFQTKRNQ